ncbi:penicillin-binding protein 2 [Patescibacteria group bacterium]|nr:penicillin-binding protein 2 [Patescibacteria group bacterium]MBU0964568.1 penicillin-binding protein 2 [Patescibacteria group bacterium]
MVGRIRRGSKPERRKSYDRIDILRAVVFVFAALIIVRLSDIQIFQHSFYEALAADQHSLSEKLFPKRGEIFVRDKDDDQKLYPLAANKVFYLVYAEPKRVEDAKAATEKLAPLLELEEEEILPRLEKENDLYEPLKHQVTQEVVDQIAQLELSGIEYQEEFFRYYPENNIGAHLLGFVGFSGDIKAGQYGLEEYWEKELAGEYGYLQAEKDAQGRWITFGTKLLEEAKDGDDLILTVDRTVQYEACKTLNESVQKHGADGGSVIIINPKTSAILAMCGSPDFDPNKYNEVEDINVYINPATFYIYEPGSVFKPFTMAAALDQGAVSPSTTYEDTGSVEIGKYTIKNSDGQAHGINTMTQVLEQSLNTGIIFAARTIGPEKFEDYIKRFGFGEKYDLEINSEAKGNISSLAKHSEIYMATGSFGQGLSVTLLQLTNAFASIANNGKLMQPYIIDERVNADGFGTKTEPRMIRQAITSKTATTLSAMLVNVVRNGHGQRAGVPGYFIAGKTGTAQVANQDGPGYDPNITVGSFCGFGPVDNPAFVMCVRIDRPRDVQWAESSAAPLFGELAQFMLNYYGIPPEESVE